MSRVLTVHSGPGKAVIMAGIRGRPGATITTAEFDSEGRLVITLEDGTQLMTEPLNRPFESIIGDPMGNAALAELFNAKVDGVAYQAFVIAVNEALGERYTKVEVDQALLGKVNDDDPRLSDARVPTGGAGGVLSGQYPNPGFAVDMATQAELDAVAAAKVDKVAGKGLSTNDLTDPLYDKLVGLEGTHWRGTFVSLAALEAGVPDPAAGDYADVDVVGEDVRRYIWDATDSAWVAQSGEVAPLTAAQVKLLYESNPDTNAFTGAEKAKLSEAVVTTDPRLTDAREWAAETVGQAEAEAGAATTRRAWTAQRVRQAIVAWWESVSSAWGRGFVASADVGAARAALELGTAATADAGDFDPAGSAANALSSANSYTDSLVGDIGAALDAINGEVI